LDHGALKRAVLVALIALPFVAAIAAKVPICPSAALLGIPCPGCGLTRATLAVLRGDFGAALRFHPLVFLLAPIYLGLLGLTIVGYVRGTPPTAPEPSAGTPRQQGVLFTRTVTVIATVTLVLVIAVWIARFLGAFGGPVPVESYRSWRGPAPAAPTR
jgi:hypothetical protein